MSQPTTVEQKATTAGTLGTFTGVFTPSILTILGIILFLRLGFSIGNAGLTRGLIIIGITTAVSVLTSVSLAAIATNIEVKGGGDYYMISRTLGVEFGGAIGTVLFLAQSVSIAFYAVGFGEAVAAMAGASASWAPQAIGAAAIGALFVLAWLGADAATKFQFGVMALLIAALASFFLGAIPGFDGDVARAGLGAPAGSLSFWAVFAIFFPAVTGFTQGVSMSGDLKNPGRSLPLGTFAAVGVSTVVYVAAAVLLAGNASSQALIEDTNALRSVAAVGPLIDAGVIAATLSSAMASFLGAPRILQSLAKDRVFPALTFFAAGHGPTANPRRGVVLSLVIGLVTVSLGDLNVIAPVVSMFFLISYGLLNYATYYEARALSPSFRPRFRWFDKRLSLVGAFGCLGAMFAINPVAGLGALLVLGAIHQYLRRSDRPERWADASHSYYFQRARESIQAMKNENGNARSWRPQILAFSADPVRRARLLLMASWLEGESGMIGSVEIVVGDGALARKERQHREQELSAQIEEMGLAVHGKAVLAADAMEALPVIVQSFGLGPLSANTVLFGWPENQEEGHLRGYRLAVQAVGRLGVHVVSMMTDPDRWDRLQAMPGRERRIDVWWQDDDASRVALLAAYLFTRTSDWSKATIRVITEGPDEAEALAELGTMLEEARIPGEPTAVTSATPAKVIEVSADATFVFLPMRVQRGELIGPFGLPLDDLVPHLPTSASVLAGAPFELSAGPESERHLELTAAEERVDAATARLRALQREFQPLESEHERLEKLAANGDSEADLMAALEEVRLLSADVKRRIAKARAKLDAAQDEVETLTKGST